MAGRPHAHVMMMRAYGQLVPLDPPRSVAMPQFRQVPAATALPAPTAHRGRSFARVMVMPAIERPA